MTTGFIDAHNHLQATGLESFLEKVIPACEGLGVARMIVNGITEQDWDRIKELASRHGFVTPSYGLHPWYLKEKKPGWEKRLEERLISDAKAHVGEVGLDLWMRDPDLPSQIETLRHSLQIAERNRRAITIHCLRAWEQLLDVLRSERLPARGFLLHAYSGPPEMVGPFTELGAYFSFSGYFLNPGKEDRLASFRQVRSDRLLAETDAPSMPLPDIHSEFRLPGAIDGETINHPGNIRAVYAALSSLRKVDLSDLVKICTENSNRLFGEA
ncbi:MAG: TatD family hydrolase [Verrucomicrobia bacterium]|nr:TatD family hydrolase [Verrucomicrobiota bacterium]